MKLQLLGIIIFLYSFHKAAAQIEVPPETQKKITLRIETQAAALKQKLERAKMNAVVIEFTIDTFRAERAMVELIALSNSDFNMRDATYHAADAYDSLLNKYYRKLLNVFKGDDKKVLIQAQKAWLLFRDSEIKLVAIVSKDDYSGGGTIQRLAESSEYLDLVKSRTLAVFAHYARATESY